MAGASPRADTVAPLAQPGGGANRPHRFGPHHHGRQAPMGRRENRHGASASNAGGKRWRGRPNPASTGVSMQESNGAGPPLPPSALPHRARGGMALVESGRSGDKPKPPGLPHLPLLPAPSGAELHSPAHLPSASGADRPWRTHHPSLLGLDRRDASPAGVGTGGGMSEPAPGLAPRKGDHAPAASPESSGRISSLESNIARWPDHRPPRTEVRDRATEVV